MSILSQIGNGAGGKDVRDTLNNLLNTVAALLEASFTTLPAISGNVNRVVGDVFAYTPGTVGSKNIILGKTYLYRGVTRVKELTSGSDTFGAIGDYKIRTYILNMDVFVDSDVVFVTQPVAGAITPPHFYFDSARVTGKNPPEVFWNDVDDTVLATDTLEIEWTINGAVFTKQIPMDITSRSLHEFLVTEWEDLAAGPFSLRGRYRRTKDIDGNTIPLELSGWTNPPLADTLASKTLTAPATVWDIQNKSQYVNVDNSDYLTAEGQNVGAEQPILTTISRDDKRFAEMKVTKNEGPPFGGFNIGISPADAIAQNFSTPANSVAGHVDEQTYVVGDVFSVLVTPKVGSTAGQLIVLKNGIQFYTTSHNLTEYKLLFSPSRQTGVRLNTGKETFSYPPTDTTYVRYN